MRIHRNRALAKFTQFFFMRTSISCIIMYGAIKLYAVQICDRCLTRIIHIKLAPKNVALRYIYHILKGGFNEKKSIYICTSSYTFKGVDFRKNNEKILRPLLIVNMFLVKDFPQNSAGGYHYSLFHYYDVTSCNILHNNTSSIPAITTNQL